MAKALSKGSTLVVWKILDMFIRKRIVLVIANIHDSAGDGGYITADLGNIFRSAVGFDVIIEDCFYQSSFISIVVDDKMVKENFKE